MINIVLVEPEIPPNTGNIARTCALTGAKLHLVKPLGFSIGEKELKRAGLDYWDNVDLEIHESLESFLQKYKGELMFYSTTKAKKFYTDVQYLSGCFILFGKETAGLPMKLIEENIDYAIKIPMKKEENLRSLNLSNAVNIVLYEALRQNEFSGLV